MYFNVSIGVMILGSFFSSISSAVFSNDRKNLFRACFFGLTQLEIFVDAYFSIRDGEKTESFAYSRLFEGMVEAAPQALLQLYIVLISRLQGFCCRLWLSRLSL